MANVTNKRKSTQRYKLLNKLTFAKALVDMTGTIFCPGHYKRSIRFAVRQSQDDDRTPRIAAPRRISNGSEKSKSKQVVICLSFLFSCRNQFRKGSDTEKDRKQTTGG
ncbi:hypothetical protein J6590_105191 [Homalodisca vitripennis]|nr:hypothetical protein J6590_105191 [Homalodisca vitripennis]